MAKKRPFEERAAEVIAVLPEHGSGKMTHREIVAALEAEGKSDSVELIYPMLLTKRLYCKAETTDSGKMLVWYSRLPATPAPTPTVSPVPVAPKAQ